MSIAQRELVTIGPQGRWDCLLEIDLVAAPARTRARSPCQMYGRWAAAQHYEVDWVCVPRDDEERCIWLIKGHYAYGHLQLEQGLHRVRRGKENATCRVTVRPWLEDKIDGHIDMIEHRALKGDGLYGQRIRSRLICEGGLHLQNGQTIAQNMDLARELLPSWLQGRSEANDIVRRYDLSPLHIRDVATGWSTSRTDALGPKAVHELLLHRIDHVKRESGEPEDN